MATITWAGLLTASARAQTGPPNNGPDKQSIGLAHSSTDDPGANRATSPQSAQSGQKQDSRGALVIVPLPISSPALGSGIVPVLGYIFTLGAKEKTSLPSVLGVSGLATDNGSSAIFFGGELYFKQNAYRVTAAYASGNLNYNLYGLGEGTSQSKLPLTQEGRLFFAEFLRRIGWNFLIGPRLLNGNSLITLRGSENAAPLPPDIGLRTSLTALGFRLYRDTRDNRFYPTSGSLIDFTSDFYSPALGSKYFFQSYQFSFSKYERLTTKQVLAYNFFSCATGGQPPFYGNCIYGKQNQLRGYVAGRYLARYMITTQVEYRRALVWRLGAVGFGGLGGAISGGNQPFRTSNFLPSAGAGLRFRLNKKYDLNLRADVAFGKDSHTFGLGVGEAF